MLGIEVNGSTHNHPKTSQKLENGGVTLLRLEDIEIKNNIADVLKGVKTWIKMNPPKSH